jgi:hypothetical protein
LFFFEEGAGCFNGTRVAACFKVKIFLCLLHAKRDCGKTVHAWFTAFAPMSEPEISITVLVEGAGEGSNVAAPVAKKILEEWFGR